MPLEVDGEYQQQTTTVGRGPEELYMETTLSFLAHAGRNDNSRCTT